MGQFDTITTNTFDNIFVNVTPLEYQEKVTYLLSNIDKLIEVKTHENKNIYDSTSCNPNNTSSKR